MKNLRDKFKFKDNFVKPLYKKVKFDNRVKPKTLLDVSQTKLCGNEVYVKRKIVEDYNVINVEDIRECDRTLPGASICKRNTRLQNNNSQSKSKCKLNNDTFICKNDGTKCVNDIMAINEENGYSSKSIQAVNDSHFKYKTPDTWLRIYPAVQTPGESTLSVISRCVVCQLGLATFLVLWTIAWVFVIHFFEGPFEMEVSIQFEKEQNQLVIDLATELRQITPLSPKWKYAIEKRIEDERELTMRAVARGAKLHPGEFWNLSGTFLFTVYVMTALGFGAPVPQTMWGRSSGLVYALMAVPTHIYLMVNFSTCVVANTEAKLNKFKSCLRRRKHNLNESSSHNCNSDIIKIQNQNILRRRMICLFNVLSFGRCVPLFTVTYYALGAISFGVLRGRRPLEIVMFPLEFTTTGGLEHVENYVRIIYGFYVEGAMMLLACSLATLRRHSSSTMNVLSEKYRLFSSEK